MESPIFIERDVGEAIEPLFIFTGLPVDSDFPFSIIERDFVTGIEAVNLGGSSEADCDFLSGSG